MIVQLSQLSPARARDGGQKTGTALVEELGLQPEPPGVVIGCHYGTEAEDGEAYCLDGKVTNELDFWLTALRLRGFEATEGHRRFFELLIHSKELEKGIDDVDHPRHDDLMRVVREMRELRAELPGI